MADIFDYLKWRGDLSINADGINDVDALILSRLSYLPFDRVIPNDADKSISIKKSADLLKSADESNFLWKNDSRLAQELAKTKRFSEMKLFSFVNMLEKNEKMQFCALAIELNEGLYYISFRGTDNSVIGWQEDFNMYYMFPLPSQVTAVKYFEALAENLKGSFILGGHSKGGNLAVYSAAFCKPALQKRIKAVYNHDGPGFNGNVIAQDGFKKIEDKVHTYVPQSSIFGMMLEHSESYTIVKSTQKGFFQHDIYSWEIERTQLVKLNEMTNTSTFFDHTLSEFAYSLSNSEKKEFIEAIFSLLENTEDKTFNEIMEHWYKNSAGVLKSLKNMDSKTRKLILSTLAGFIKCAKHNFSDINPLTKQNRYKAKVKRKTKKAGKNKNASK